ncbi:MAG TPA: hypothetical protein DHV28_01475 [Ignavibacteriales bacterium]|nr:hypothetical protein [Ignavibacteriales bacterium]
MRNKLDILYVEISKVDYSDIIISIKNSLKVGQPIIITGANVNTINLALENLKFGEVLSKFNLVHPDGIGVFLASKFLYGKNGFTKRINGSDFYTELIKESLKNNWSYFFFGDTDETLTKISKANPDLCVKGFCNGFNFINDELIKNINTAKPDILIVGLGSPKQEDWIVNNKENVNTKVIIAVGDGIKVFAGTKKRGPKIIQKIGLEWFVRFLYEPKRLWKRYFIGIPLFIFRVMKFKFMNTKTG